GDEQRPALPGDPVVTAAGEERLGLPQPGDRLTPAVADGRLGHEAQGVPRPVAPADRRTGPLRGGARLVAPALATEHDGVDQREEGVAEPGPDEAGLRDLGPGGQAEVVV